MLDNWLHGRRLARLHKQRRRTQRRHAPLLKSAREKSQDAYESAFYDYIADQDEIDDMIAELTHGWLMDRAERYGIDVSPRRWTRDNDDDENWQRSRFSGRYFISNKEAARLRSAVRLERKERFEDTMRWVPSIVSILSLVVAILALLNGYDKVNRTATPPSAATSAAAPAR